MNKMPSHDELDNFREYLKASFREALTFVADHATEPDAFLSYKEFPNLCLERMPKLKAEPAINSLLDYSSIFKRPSSVIGEEEQADLGRARSLLAEFLERHRLSDWMGQNDNSLTSSIGEGERTHLGGAIFPPSQFPSVQRLMDWISQNDKFRGYFSDELFTKRFIPFTITNMIANAVDRYIHLFKTMTFSHDRCIYVLNMLIKGVIDPILQMSLAIPIANTVFDFENLPISPDFYIMQMPRRFQLARAMDAVWWKACSPALVAATHAFVVENMEIANDHYNAIDWTLMHLSNYPTDHIESFLGSLSLVTGISTGYAQILAIPRRWAKHYVADLTPLYGVCVRRYPDSFDDHLRSARSTVSRRAVEEVREIFQTTLCQSDNRVNLALRRFYRCFLRDDLEDAVIDAAIILELLFGDSHSEALSYKIRMRSAALVGLDADRRKTAEQVRRDIQKLYDRRSAIVHGGTGRNKNKKVLEEQEDVEYDRTVLMEPVRYVVSILLKNPEYLERGRIDNELLLRHREDNVGEQGSNLDGAAGDPATS